MIYVLKLRNKTNFFAAGGAARPPAGGAAENMKGANDYGHLWNSNKTGY
jgi:hypothetical protein